MPTGYPGSGPIGKKRLKRGKVPGLAKPLALAPISDANPFVTSMTQKNMDLQTENAQLKRQVDVLKEQVTTLQSELGLLAIDALRMMKTDRL